MKKTLHRANTRGHADHGWLKSQHTFSFASYYNPERMGFGLLRVLNDDQVLPNKGFDTHPHRDMEIISVPLSGALRHKDSEGNETVIRHGEVQLMSAGTGVFHSEHNNSGHEAVNLLQIWVTPEKRGIAPRYDQRKFELDKRKNRFQTVVSPLDKNGEGIKINQQAYFSLIDLDSNKNANYEVNEPGHGTYIFVLGGEVEIGAETLLSRDAIGIEGTDSIPIVAKKDSQLLLIEVPMV